MPFDEIPISSVPSPEEAEAILSSEFDRLSLEEKEIIHRDVRGEVDIETSVQKSVAKYLDGLESEIQKLCHEDDQVDTSAYETAESMSPQFVHRYSFRLMFLRADLFDVRQAAIRVIRHFQRKRELFGDFYLVTDLTMEHLNADDLEVAACGSLTVLPQKDKAGRTVVINRPALAVRYKMKNLFRHFWVFAMDLARDERIQIDGFVAVAHDDGLDLKSIIGYMQQGGPTRAAIPSRISSAHYCIDGPAAHMSVSLVRHFQDRSTKFRSQHHSGPRAEIELKLRQCGIPNHFPPSISLAEMMLMIRAERIQKQQEFERKFRSKQPSLLLEGGTQRECDTPAQKKSHVEIVEIGEETLLGDIDDDFSLDLDLDLENDEPIVPQKFDVCFGRGRSRDHTGNRRLHCIVDMYREKYKSGTRYQKTAIAEQIVKLVHEAGGRFLKQDEDGLGWTMVEFPVAREKVSKLFRPRKK